MSLQFIIGGSGTGKSHYAFETIIREAASHPDVLYYIVVPEQFTMQTQQTVVEQSPGKGILNIDVLSFQRLAYRVFEEVGGDTRTLLSDIGKSMVLRKLSQERSKELFYLGRQMDRPGCLDEVKSLISEFMQYDIGEEELSHMISAAPEKSLLRRKLQDIRVLYNAFKAYMGDHYTTAEEIPDLLLKVIPFSRKIKGSVLLLDGYTGFTPVQINLIRELLALCSRVIVTVTMDTAENGTQKGKSWGLFSMSRKMIASLRALESDLEEPVLLAHTGVSRFSKAPAMCFLEKNLFRYRKSQYPEAPEEIQIWSAVSPREEVEDTARRIRKLVREKGFRYGDIAVITGNLEEYASLTREIFRQRDIPCFIDETHSVLMNPFVEFVRASLEMVRRNFSYESVFRYLRCGLSDVTREEADRLENYVLALGIRSLREWEETWVRNYRGMDPEELLPLNDLRAKFVSEVSEFRKDMEGRGHTVLEYCSALYRFILRCGIQEKLAGQEKEFREAGDLAMEKEYGQIYGIVIDLLDQLAQILGEERVSLADFLQILEAGFAKAKIALIPPGQDQVLVGDMERTRLQDIRALFFMGVNEGHIPRNTSQGGILTEGDRAFFASEGIELAPDPREQINIQRFYLYLNLTRPRDILQLSCCTTSGKGEAVTPAYLIGTIMSLFPLLEIKNAEKERLSSLPEEPLAAVPDFLRMLSMYSREDPDPLFGELYSWYLSEPAYTGRIRQLTELSLFRKGADRITREAAAALYGEVEKSGATRLERFASCAFAHFLRYGLRLQERVRYEFRPADMGTLMHTALERFSIELEKNDLTWDSLSDEERDRLILSCLEDADGDYGNSILESNARNAYMKKRAQRILKRTVWALQKQLSGSDFAPEGFEVAFGGGRIDRLDILKENGKVYVKIIDYKTGNTTFDLTRVYYGLQLQLMIYLDAALQVEKKRHPEAEIIPAGLFYFHVKDPFLSGSLDTEESELEEERLKEYKMSGLAWADPGITRRMDASGKAIPVGYKEDGSFTQNSSVATSAQMRSAGRHTAHLVDEFCRRILEGDTRILPWRLGSKTPCEYCEYRDSCGFDRKIPGYEYKELLKMDKAEFWKKIEEEDKEENHGG